MSNLLRATLLCGLAICTSPPAIAPDKPAPIGPKLQPYIGCVNRLSERSYSSRDRYLSWSKESGPTGKERIIYGLYTIYDTSDCRKNVEAASVIAPKNEELEKAGAAYAAAVGALEPLLKEADDYYTQENYKDDKMAKGKAMHPKLMAAWASFATADTNLRGVVQKLNDISQMEELAEVENSIFEGQRSGEGIFLLQNAEEAREAVRTMDNLVGNWAIIRAKGTRLCRLTLTNTPTEGDNFALFTKPPCESPVAAFAPLFWRLERGVILMIAKGGETWRFEPDDLAQWRRVPEDTDQLVLERQ